MIRCSKCGHIGVYTDGNCPECKEKIILTPEEMEYKIAEVANAEAKKQYELAAEGHHILADMGRIESQKEYARLLEKGHKISRDLDKAMQYYYMAAEKNDAFCAYRYSRLAERTSEKVAEFWLEYSAALGCVDAYPVMAEKLAKAGDDELANYYYAMSAAYDDTDSIVTLAKRYYNGVGTEQSLPYAKWYMDKLSLPPFHAIKTAYKLRSVKGQDPGMPKHPDYDKMLRRLSNKAKEYDYMNAYHHLSEMLAERGDNHAKMMLGLLYADGIGCSSDADKAIELLYDAAKHGNPESYKYLGDIFVTGIIVEQDVRQALECYKEAAKLGMTEAYETIGDIFLEGKLVKKSVTKAIELYDIGAREGHEGARHKSEDLKSKREQLCKRGLIVKSITPEDALKCFAISSSMGYTPAYKEMARCFRDGIGIKKDRGQAFLWFEKAVNAKDEEAICEYGLCYSRGIGTAFNFSKAKDILARAARGGSEEAKEELARIMNAKRRHMVDAVYSKAMRLLYMKKFEDAENMLRLCLKFNHGKGIYALGCLNEFGLGIQTNRDLAYRLYETAYELKFRDPKAEYKLRILKMTRAYIK